MRYYWVKTNRIIKWLFPNYVWDMNGNGKTVYLTFDDGPTPEITEWVLSQLDAYQAKATFFCIGSNIARNPGIFKKVIANGHSIGNHTFGHVNGWHTPDANYLENVNLCEKEIDKFEVKNSRLFRPPYGKLNKKQSMALRNSGYKIVMWDILSADFDTKITPEKCLDNVLKNINSGSIIIFHDSVKAFGNLQTTLPKTLQFLKENGYECAAIG